MQRSDIQSRHAGFCWLLSVTAGAWGRLLDQVEHRARLDTHPFGLSVPGSILAEAGKVELVGDPAVTKLSLQCFAAVFVHWLTLSDTLTHLRRILLGASPDHPDQHDIFYEVGTPKCLIIMGGCTDYSGGGREGARYMDGLFALLSATYGVEVSSVPIPYACAEVLQQELRQELLRQRRASLNP